MAPPNAAARSRPSCRLRTIVSPDTRNSSMRMYQGPIGQPALGGQPPQGGLGLGPHGEVVVDHRHLPVEQEVGVRGSASRRGRNSSSRSTSRSRNVWNGWYHSRSQWVWGTMSSGPARPRRYGSRQAAGCRGLDGVSAARGSEDARMLVLGSGRKSRLGRWVLGSTSETCAHRAGCPVVIVPAPPARPTDPWPRSSSVSMTRPTPMPPSTGPQPRPHRWALSSRH